MPDKLKKAMEAAKTDEATVRGDLGSDTIATIKDTADGKGVEVTIKGTFRSGDSAKDTLKALQKFWKTIDVDA